MDYIGSILSQPAFIFTPDFIGWAGWLLYLGLIVVLLFNLREQNRSWTRTRQIIFALLFLLVPLTSLFFGVQFDPSISVPFPSRIEDPAGPVAMLFSMVPWILAGGLLGPFPAVLLAATSGLLTALWGTHSVFTILEYPLLAIIFAAVVGQRYRTPTYQLLRVPFFSALLLALAYPLIHSVEIILTAPDSLVERVGFALSSMPGTSLAIGVQLVVAGAVAQMFSWVAPQVWYRSGPPMSSPAERSLRTRFMLYLSPLALLLVIVLMSSNWLIAGNAARALIQDRMRYTSDLVASNIPYFLETGQQLISRLAQEESLQKTDGDEQRQIIRSYIQSVPFFHQISYVDPDGDSINGYPSGDYAETSPSTAEARSRQYASQGVPNQAYARTLDGSQGLQVSFATPVLDSEGNVHGVLIGRTTLESNPLTKPLLANLQEFAQDDGTAILVDKDGYILYHPDPDLIMTEYTGSIRATAGLVEDLAADGNKRLVYFQPVPGRDWTVILTAPALRAQSLALQIAGPILVVIFILSVLAVILLSIGIGRISRSLKNLSLEANRISHGELDQPLLIDSEDEVGDLRRNFEQMRISLKSRLDDLNRLLVVSTGIAASPELDESLRPVLNAALAYGASSARVVLIPAIIPELDDSPTYSVSFGTGEKSETYKPLDDQILAFNQRQDQLLLTNGNRIRLLHFPSAPGAGVPKPEALLAFSLRHESLFYGSLWIAYDSAHKFSSEEIRFMIALSNQASLAAANARLFLSAEVGRQRLAAIIESSPDPVLVTDHNEQLLIANQAAIDVLGLDWMNRDLLTGRLPVWKMIENPDLVKLLSSESSGKETIEVQLAGDKIWQATASSIRFEGEQNGRVCILRDVTRFKHLDTMKSEFVSTVSHDLRQPLTMMRGYATMLEMVGQMSEQQNSYVRKIVSGVESMSHLVNNLLDLGRIEAGIGLRTVDTSLRDMFEEVISNQQLQAVQKRITVSMEVAPEVPEFIEVDPSLIQQAVSNLLDNALKYTRPQGKIILRAMKRRDRVLIQVIDNGIGISPLDQPRLFEKFYRGAQGTSKDTQGTGLGLAIVKSIVDRHGGQVWVESRLGKGSTFTILIPIQQESVTHPEPPSQVKT